MTYFMGIDGGGSAGRVVIVAPDMRVLALCQGDTVNPSLIGHAESARRIQDLQRAALAEAQLSPQQIKGVGIGVAGAAATHSADWLREIVAVVLPQTPVIPSSDMEIALVGANAERRGVLILSGTGSVAYGVNAAGETAQVGGWGYLLGDEGSGYWVSLQALQAVARAADGRGTPTDLTGRILRALGLSSPQELIAWLYRSETPPTQLIAQLAPLVIDTAERGDIIADGIVEAAAQELSWLGQTVVIRLNLDKPQITFAGGLLEKPNRLSRKLCQLLNLPLFPSPFYPPVVGAALLAKLTVAA